MAVRFDNTAGKRMTRSTDLLNYNAAYTVSFWLYIVALPGSGFNDFVTVGSNATSVDLFEIRSTGVINLFVNVASSTGSAPAIGQWHHIFIVRESASSLKLYLNGTLDISNTTNIGARAASLNMTLGAAFYNGSYLQECNARFANIKIWSADKTANLAIEKDTILPQDFNDLYGYYPVWAGDNERGFDYSGNGRNWTETGALTDEDSPPIGYGSPLYLLPTKPAKLDVSGVMAILTGQTTVKEVLTGLSTTVNTR